MKARESVWLLWWGFKSGGGSMLESVWPNRYEARKAQARFRKEWVRRERPDGRPAQPITTYVEEWMVGGERARVERMRAR